MLGRILSAVRCIALQSRRKIRIEKFNSPRSILPKVRSWRSAFSANCSCVIRNASLCKRRFRPICLSRRFFGFLNTMLKRNHIFLLIYTAYRLYYAFGKESYEIAVRRQTSIAIQLVFADCPAVGMAKGKKA